MELAFTYPDVAQLCEKTLSFLSSDLISENYRKKLLHFASLLPQRLRFSNFGFECPLQGNENWGDILFYIDLLKESSLHDIAILPEPWQKCAGWNRLSQIAKAYFERYHTIEDLRGLGHNVWLEFDVGSSFHSPHTPSIFFEPKEIKNTALSKILHTYIPFLDISDSTLTLIQKCSDPLTEDFSIAQIGFMLSRPSNTPLRLFIRGQGLNSTSLLRYLAQIGISDFPISMLKILKSLESLTDGIALDLDIVDEKLSSKIGLEFFISPRRSNKEELWHACFDILHSACAIDPKKRTVLEWYGHTLDYIGNSLEPPYFFLSSYRTISHVKLVYVPGQDMYTKIYLNIKLDIIQRANVTF